MNILPLPRRSEFRLYSLIVEPDIFNSILGNHMEDLWETVKDIRGGRIDFVLDNAGFELYCDCVYGGWLSFDLNRRLVDTEPLTQPTILSNPAWLPKSASTVNAYPGSSLTSPSETGNGS